MAKKVDARLEKRQETLSCVLYFVLYLNRRRIKKKSILLFSSRHAIAMRMPMQGSCHSCTTFFPSLALPCHEPYDLHLPDTAYIYPTPVRLAVFCTFLPFAPADPVGYLSHVLRLHRERTTGYTVPVSTSIYTSLYTDFVYKRKACKLPARALSLSHPSLSIYLSTLPSPASSIELYQPTTRHTPLAIVYSLTHSLPHSPVF